MQPLILKIDGDPVPWAAPTFSRKGTYDKKAQAKKVIVWKLKTKYRGIPIEGALQVDFFFGMPVPTSQSKKKRDLMLAGKIFHTCKPDRDNMQKLYSDALEKSRILKNDSQIVAGQSKKFYHSQPHTLIIIQRLDHGD